MKLLFPNPRYRIYTKIHHYTTPLARVALGRVTTGDEPDLLAGRICRDFGSPHALCVPQARVGIYLAVKTLVPPGKKIILSPYTIADVINMVICAGAIPVFADIDPGTCNISVSEVERLIDDNTAAVLATHLHGLAADSARLRAICDAHDIAFIEDAAQAFGTVHEGRYVGTFGDAGIYSFGMYKNITSFYGGLVLTPHVAAYSAIEKELGSFPYSENVWLAKRIVKAMVTGMVTSYPLFQLVTYWIFRYGHLRRIRAINRFVETELDLTRKTGIPEKYLRRMTPMQARLVLDSLDSVAEDNEKRVRYAHIYHEGLSDIPDLTLPPLRDDGSHIYTYFPIMYRERKALVRWLMLHKRDVAVQHLKNCADLPAFHDFFRDCPEARRTAEEVILLPTYPRYGKRQVHRNVEVIRDYFRK